MFVMQVSLSAWPMLCAAYDAVVAFIMLLCHISTLIHSPCDVFFALHNADMARHLHTLCRVYPLSAGGAEGHPESGTWHYPTSPSGASSDIGGTRAAAAVDGEYRCVWWACLTLIMQQWGSECQLQQNGCTCTAEYCYWLCWGQV